MSNTLTVNPYRACQNVEKGTPVAKYEEISKAGKIDLNNDGVDEYVYEFKFITFRCPSEKVEQFATMASPLSNPYFVLEKGVTVYLGGNIIGPDGIQYIAIDYFLNHAITWKGDKPEIDRSQIRIQALPLDAYKRATENPKKKGEEIYKHAVYFPLDEVKPGTELIIK